MKACPKVLIIGEHSYIGNSFKQYIENCKNNGLQSNMNSKISGQEIIKWQVDTVGASNREWKQIDFSSYNVILHVAAIVHQKESPDKQQLYIDVNEKLPVEIARKAREAGVGQFIFLSTMAVYGDVEGAITEKTPLNPVTMYGKTKLEAEQRLQELVTNQFKVTVLRPPMVYGDNCPGNYTRLKEMAKVLPIFPDIDNKRSMIHIDNLSRCIADVIEKGDTGNFHPQDKQLVKTTDLYIKLRKDMGKKTYTTKLFNWLVILLKGKVGSINKLFGSCYYRIE